MKTKRRSLRQLGQTITEYVLIIAVVAVAAVGILAAFSDTVRSKIVGIVSILDGDDAAGDPAADSQTVLEDLGDQ